jgi:hypothetical protein
VRQPFILLLAVEVVQHLEQRLRQQLVAVVQEPLVE